MNTKDIKRCDFLETLAGDLLTLIYLEDEIKSLLAVPIELARRVY